MALHGVTHGTMRLLSDRSVKAGGAQLRSRWSSVCIWVDNLQGGPKADLPTLGALDVRAA